MNNDNKIMVKTIAESTYPYDRYNEGYLDRQNAFITGWNSCNEHKKTLLSPQQWINRQDEKTRFNTNRLELMQKYGEYLISETL